MPRYAEFDRAALAAILRAQEHVISRGQAFGCGMTRNVLHGRTKPDGPWQRLLPGVYLAQTGTPTVPQQEMAALLHGGPGSVLTGQAALHGLGLVATQPGCIAGAVQRGDCPLSALARELHEGQIWDSARLRRVLEEVADGVRSVTEGEFRDLISRARLPWPQFNPRLFAADGGFIASPDAWWAREGVAAEIDSREWHLNPAGGRLSLTMERPGGLARRA